MNARFHVQLGRQPIPSQEAEVSGEFITLHGQRYYVIRSVDKMSPFFTCTVSGADHWLFASSTGGLTCGRRNSTRALFPYVTEDKIRDNFETTGPYSAFLVGRGNNRALWEPFRRSGELAYELRRNLYKSVEGDKLRFEEVNETLGLSFSYEWCTSEQFGFARRCELTSHGRDRLEVRVLDGVLNVLPACVDEQMQLGFSCLLDAYKKSEQVGPDGLVAYSLASQVVDRAEPREALRASTAFGLGLPQANVLVSDEQIGAALRGMDVTSELLTRGRRGAYLMQSDLTIGPDETQRWQMVFDVERSQAQVARLVSLLADEPALERAIVEDVSRGTKALREIVAATDGEQLTADEATTVHHFANTLFNDMRGGVYADGYRISAARFEEFVRDANKNIWEARLSWLKNLPETLTHEELVHAASATKDADLERFALEYLPLTFSRRHGDPSRPWNKFDIKVRNESGEQLLGFQGNWRDIFQNWEALCSSFPGYVEGIIAKFVNASTVEGFNPYRITDHGIDWEVPEPDNPWAGIGYWGDHQIVYLLKLLEHSRAHHRQRLSALLEKEIFTYANVPYRVKSFAEICENPQDTIEFDEERDALTGKRTADLGSDGKLLLRDDGSLEVYRVNLTEKLLVTSLAKMSNFVPGAGVWLNTQRPEWNDANNALVGSGTSMVTLYYMNRFFHYLEDLFAHLGDEQVVLSAEVSAWLRGTLEILVSSSIPEDATVDDQERRSFVESLGRTFEEYRKSAYEHGLSKKVEVSGAILQTYVRQCRRHLKHTMQLGRRADGLYHAYNLIQFEDDERLTVEPLYEMLEGQVAALSAGTLDACEVIELLTTLRSSQMYRPDQKSYMLYPDRSLAGFLEKNEVPESLVEKHPLLRRLVDSSSSIVARDAHGKARFGCDLYNAERLETALAQVPDASPEEIQGVLSAYEDVFRHHEFTGRSGTMFGYEGLGSIYWHMVAKLLLAVQENFFWAEERGATVEERQELKRLYYEIREGVGGFNKSPDVYGAFPMDPYSHTPERSGARQPGMTGQVKEEVLTRLGEVGVRVRAGRVRFEPSLLRQSELFAEAQAWSVEPGMQSRTVEVPQGGLGFTYCGVPVIYDRATSGIEVVSDQGVLRFEGVELDEATSARLFRRDGIETIRVGIEEMLSSD